MMLREAFNERSRAVGCSAVAKNSYCATALLRCQRRGFTAVELLIVLAIFVISAATTLPFLGMFREAETLSSISEDVAQTLRRAQHRAMSGQRERPWGVKFGEGHFILFGGASFARRLPALDELHRVPPTYTFSGLAEIAFTPLTGMPMQGSGTVTISHPDGGSKRVEVNAVGAIFLAE